MAVRPEEIASILKQQIERFGAAVTAVDVGVVIEAGDGIARVHGLSNCLAGELVEFANGAMGLALNLEEDTIGIMVLGDYTTLGEGAEVRSTGRIVAGAGRRGADRPRRRPAGQPYRRQGADRDG